MSPERIFKVGGTGVGDRVDRFLSTETGLTRSRIQKLIEAGLVTLAGSPVRANQKTRVGEEYRIIEPDSTTTELIPEDIPIAVLFQDEHIVIVNKPAGLVVYPAAGHPSGTLMNALRFHVGHLASIGAPLRPGVVHRLDKDTSGVMVFAKTDDAYYSLQKQFRNRTITRRYRALVYGRLSAGEGTIDKAVGRSEQDRKKISTRTRRGKDAVTLWKRINQFREGAEVEVRLLTGRTHQIRVHFASIGHPVLGDRIYGRKTSLGNVRFPRQMLHAECLGVDHPVTGTRIEYCVPVPADMKKAIEKMGGEV